VYDSDHSGLGNNSEEEAATNETEGNDTADSHGTAENEYPDSNIEEPAPAKFTARMYDNVWGSANMENSRFRTVEDFHSEIDYYINVVSEFVMKEHWFEQYVGSPQIEFRLEHSGSRTEIWGRRVIVYLSKIAFEHDLAPIAHEIAHVINPTRDRTASLDEGLAGYLHTRFGQNPTVHTFGIDAHILAKVFFTYHAEEYNAIFAVLGTRDSRQDRYLSGDLFLRQVFYVLSESFATYLIDFYGIEEFMKLHASRDNLLDDYNDLYGKSYEEIKLEWQSVVESSPSMTLEGYNNHLDVLFERHNWQWGIN